MTIATLSHSFTEPPLAEAADPLPREATAADIGDGGLNINTVQLAAQTEDYGVWLARDRSHNQCVVALSSRSRNLSAFCASDADITQRSLSGAMKIDTDTDTDTDTDENPSALQVYLLANSRLSTAAADLVAGSVRYENLLVRYGPVEVVQTETVVLLPERSETTLTILGKNSL